MVRFQFQDIMTKPFKKETFVPTKENWYPPVIKDDGIYVNVVVLEYPHKYPTSPNYKVSVWGDDDFGLEKEYYTKKEALLVYDEICKLKFVEQAYLKRVFKFENG